MKQKTKIPDSPVPLGAHGTAFWDRVTSEFEIEEHHLDLLASACQQLDRAAAAAAVIASEGVTTKDRFSQVKTHLAVDAERNAHLAFCRLQRELGLDIAPPASRPNARPETRN